MAAIPWVTRPLMAADTVHNMNLLIRQINTQDAGGTPTPIALELFGVAEPPPAQTPYPPPPEPDETPPGIPATPSTMPLMTPAEAREQEGAPPPQELPEMRQEPAGRRTRGK
jgi:hypothetical protein